MGRPGKPRNPGTGGGVHPAVGSRGYCAYPAEIPEEVTVALTPLRPAIGAGRDRARRGRMEGAMSRVIMVSGPWCFTLEQSTPFPGRGRAMMRKNTASMRSAGR